MAGSNVVDLGGGCRIEFDWRAFNEIRKSDGIKAKLAELGDGMAARAGADDFGAIVVNKPTRAIALVSNTTANGAYQEAVDKVLTKAVR